MTNPYRTDPTQATVKKIVEWIRELAKNTPTGLGRKIDQNTAMIMCAKGLANQIELKWGK